MKLSIDQVRKLEEQYEKIKCGIDNAVNHTRHLDIQKRENAELKSFLDSLTQETVELKREDETRRAEHYTFYVLTDEQKEACDELDLFY